MLSLIFPNRSVNAKVAQQDAGHKNPATIETKKASQMLGRAALAFIFATLLVGTSVAQERGPVTNLPLPRFVSLKAAEGNVRRGPSLTHRIDWVFQRRDMPLEVTAEYGHWRRVQDRDGQGGWVHYSLLSGVRTVIVERDMLILYAKPDPQTQENAQLEMGVIARLGQCGPDWCRLKAGGQRGWARKDTLWGVRPDEIRE
jgi:SH3-like domain-containing protein